MTHSIRNEANLAFSIQHSANKMIKINDKVKNQGIIVLIDDDTLDSKRSKFGIQLSYWYFNESLPGMVRFKYLLVFPCSRNVLTFLIPKIVYVSLFRKIFLSLFPCSPVQISHVSFFPKTPGKDSSKDSFFFI